MDVVGSFLGSVLKPRYEEDGADRLTYQYSAWLLLAFSLTLSAKQYVGSPIQCWNPAQFTGHWEQYVHDYCFVENTYYLHGNETIPTGLGEREERQLSYYQWVPFVMALMALLCVLPHWVWRTLNRLSGLSVRGLGTMGRQAADMEPGEGRQAAVHLIAAHLKDAALLQDSLGRSGSFLSRLPCSPHSGLPLTLLYLATKLLFVGNLVVQFLILNRFLGPNHSFWGLFVLRDLASGKDWTSNGHFPRVTLCDFRVRVLGNIQRHTVQCVLMINMFNEKIFLFLWWWFVLVAVVTVGSGLRWLVGAWVPSLQQSFVRRLLAVHDLPRDRNSAALGPFVRRQLRPDGVLVLRLMAANAGELIASQVLKALWLDFLNDTQPKRPPLQPPPQGFNHSDIKAPLLPPSH